MKKVVLCALFFNSLNVFAADPNGSLWQVTQKNCAGQVAAPAGNERMEFKPSSLAHYELISANETQFCIAQKNYVRNVKSKSDISGVYTEASILIGTSVRQICYSKADHSPISDDTKSIHGPMMSTTFTLTGETGHVEVIGDRACLQGALRYDLHRAP